MSVFTSGELAFLARHKFAEDDVYDGRGEGKRWREYQAKEAGKVLILTSVRCRAMRHRIRTRAGHCAQCNPASIAFTRRETLEGYVYIAGTLQGCLMKIGEAGDIGQRVRQLKAEAYGGFSDWRILITAWVDNRGRTEREISSRITGKRVFGGYIKDGRNQTAVEMIQCPFSAAFDAFTIVVLAMTDKQYWLRKFREYEFGGPT
jgi:hypothetical protein